MNILAIETATEACSVAVANGDTVAERHEIAGRRHTALVLPMVDAALAQAGLSRAQIELVAFGCGPGSFTGVRIAAALAQGIAFAGDVPVAPVSTLLALAAGGARLTGATHVACATDARRGEVYAAAYEFGADGELVGTVLEDCVLAPERLALPGPHAWLAVGNGWDVHAPRFRKHALPARRAELPHPHAEDVARLALAMHAAGDTVDALNALPRYLRRAVD